LTLFWVAVQAHALLPTYIESTPSDPAQPPSCNLSKTILRFDNTTLCPSLDTDSCFQSYRLRCARKLPSRHDVNWCDFFLFRDLKMKLKEEEFETMESLKTDDWRRG
jgi:hypothetical protein